MRLRFLIVACEIFAIAYVLVLTSLVTTPLRTGGTSLALSETVLGTRSARLTSAINSLRTSTFFSMITFSGFTSAGFAAWGTGTGAISAVSSKVCWSMYAGAIRIPAINPATIKTPYTPKVTRRNEPFRFTSSLCDPDSTRFSNILLSSQSVPKGQIQETTRRGNHSKMIPNKIHLSSPLELKKRKGTTEGQRSHIAKTFELSRYARHK